MLSCSRDSGPTPYTCIDRSNACTGRGEGIFMMGVSFLSFQLSMWDMYPFMSDYIRLYQNLYSCSMYIRSVNTCFLEASISGDRLFGEVAWLNVFYGTLYLRTLILKLFPPILHLIRRSWPAVYLSLLTPSNLCHEDFMKLLTTAQKNLRRFRKLSRRSTMTRPWQGWRNNGSSKGEVVETAVADQRNFAANASIAGMAAEMENDRRESQNTCSAHDVLARTVHGALSITWSSKKLAKVGGQTVFLRWRRSNSGCKRRVKRWRVKRWRPWFFDSFRQHSHSLRGAGDEERAGWPHSHSGGLLEALGWGYEK